MSRRYAAVIILVSVLAIVFALWGTTGVGVVATFSAPIVIAAFATGLTGTRLPVAMLVVAAVGLIPALALVVVNELGILGEPPPESIVQSTEAGSLLIFIFLGIPCAVAGAIGGSIGALVGNHKQAAG